MSPVERPKIKGSSEPRFEACRAIEMSVGTVHGWPVPDGRNSMTEAAFGEL